MMNVHNASNTVTESTIIPLSDQPVRILKNEKDYNSQNPNELSDFMGIFAQEQLSQISHNLRTEKKLNCPINEICIVNDVIQNTVVHSKNGLNLIPDFESIPPDIKKKLKDGTYKIDESKQVSGNMRAVIVNEKGVRIKDITLKKSASNLEAQTTKCVLNQLQMKQINDNLATIIELQNYQIERARDHAVLTPFFNARDYIARAQNEEPFDKRNEYLEKAADCLTTTLNEVRGELRTNIRALAEKSKKTILRNPRTIKIIINQISDDLLLYTKSCGLIMLVYEYLGQSNNSQSELIRYNSFMSEMVNNKVEDTSLTAIELLHDNFKYNKYNRNCWHDFSIKTKYMLADMNKSINQDTYIVTLEDNENE